MLCAARVQIGPFGQAFWAVWDRDERRRFAQHADCGRAAASWR